MGEIIQNQVTKAVSFKTVVHFKNGSKETVFHVKPLQPDTNRMLHVLVSEDSGVAFNLDEVRKFETQAFVENKVDIVL